MPNCILGIDPGIASMGYGIIEERNGKLVGLDYGCFSTSPKESVAGRLYLLYTGIAGLIERHKPASMAIELFIGRNLRTALAVGQARGVAILAAATSGLPVYEYTPLEVKQSVCGYGRGDKRQIQEMVRIQLEMDSIPESDDASDALAIALCHMARARLSRLMSDNAGESSG